MQTDINIVVIKENVIEENILITGKDKDKVVNQAEFIYIKKIEKHLGKKLSQGDKEIALDEGYYEGMSFSVCINWPDIDKV